MPRASQVAPPVPLAYVDLFPPVERGWYTYDEWRAIARKAIDRGLIEAADLTLEAMEGRAAADRRLRSFTSKGGLTYLLLLRLDAVAKAVRDGVDEREFGMRNLPSGPKPSHLRLL